jgi:small conductance mechanosensitive channel
MNATEIDFTKYLNPEMLTGLAEKAVTWISVYGVKLLAALLIFLIGRMIARRLVRLAGKMMAAGKIEETLRHFLENIIYYALMAAVVIAVLGQVGINVTSFLAVLGAAGLAVGLALKDSLSNFAAGVMLILMRFFSRGDYVGVAGTEGTVESVTIFNTMLKSVDNKRVIIPNASILSDIIVNYTVEATRRIDLVIGIGYGDDIDLAKKVIKDVLDAEKRLLSDPAPTIAVAELADSSVNFVVRPWVATGNYWPTRFDLIENLKKALDANGINIPYPQHDVHLFTQDKEDK